MDWAEPVALATEGNRPFQPIAALGDLARGMTEFAAAASVRLEVGVWRPAPDLCVIALVGELCSATTATLEVKIHALGVRYPCCLVVDLSRLTSLDSSGVDALRAIAKHCANQGCTTLVVAPSDRISDALELSRVADALRLTCSLEAAVRHSGTSITFPVPGLLR
jgi:anti-anti-sigma factor